MYWKYFLALERDLEICSRYVELSPKNFPVYSIELVKVFLSLGSEIDVVLKALCNKLRPASKAGKIHHYRKILMSQFPEFPNVRVRVLETTIELEPWKEWAQGRTPLWWKAYNDVKHDRTGKYESGNLECVLNGFAALMVSILYYQYALGGGSQSRVEVGRVSMFFDTGDKGSWDPPMETFSYGIRC